MSASIPSPLPAADAAFPTSPAEAAPAAMTRRAWMARAAALTGAAALLRPRAAWAATALDTMALDTAAFDRAPDDVPNAAPLALTVYKNPECGCCEQWVTHMAAAGFRPAVHDVADLAAVKARLGVPAALHACHTAVVAGFVVEGHVPAADVRRFAAARPRVGEAPARGLAAPGMPAGSPGMEGPRAERYAVLAYAADGGTVRFASH